ncbi:PNP1 (YLR209C) [Zygosaccharomyces parabailii]|uniref:Purine nucleoside phosphorylase n=1 Tax=Zygosaccharomyces bailii (strain CLIB 213 / ATCC 58445 / CBS 680 / BCRC 21525 / NBRC 1098 / NCYC 1416 / NRRL Y-2227) TaxID=1333698 RepID=A0A8J2T9Y1_ZYGB2|nr:PNP1 (YLR209C) [Zygosaccharomyces parabailii]CDF91247.1 ZYBA0S10-03004g1_1 [Zygosaccharomyces bailii CLIB 213]CDH17016.1 probable Purine nucleoside phosphorylase [Zygosaccharomyces bailii ISA1307]SJM88275.1 probable Purine nucleoside phosphorylase [Zygosaccharomyces bailii]
MSLVEQRQTIEGASSYLAQRVQLHFQTSFEPRVLIICGSGLGGISNRIAPDNPPPLSIGYGEIPGFKDSTVPGHQGALIFGSMNGVPVVLMNGRLHSYEGHSLFEVTLPIRVLHHMGHVRQLIVTNAAGGLNPNFNTCDLMCLSDHINLPGFAGLHPLKGPNMEDVGPRFLPLSDAYDLGLRKLLFKKKQELNIARPIHEGTYMFVSGPTFETRAESRLIQKLGGDAVGMSTVPEIIVARHCGWKVLALSLITNNCVTDPPPSALATEAPPMDKGIASHAEVLENGRKASLDVERLVAAVVADL